MSPKKVFQVMSEGDGLRILSEMIHDNVVAITSKPHFFTEVKSHVGDDGEVVTDEVNTMMEVVYDGN